MKKIKAVRERVAVLVGTDDAKVLENAMPLRWQFFDEESLEKHFDDLRGANG